MNAGKEVVTRLHWSSTPLLQADGTTAFNLSGWLTGLEAEGQGEANVVIEVRKHQLPMRLVALRLSEAAATRAQHKRKARVSKKGSGSQPLTIQIADWLIVLTSLSKEDWSASQVLLLYRARWQLDSLGTAGQSAAPRDAGHGDRKPEQADEYLGRVCYARW